MTIPANATDRVLADFLSLSVYGIQSLGWNVALREGAIHVPGYRSSIAEQVFFIGEI